MKEYQSAQPKQFGTLHERMKWLIQKIHEVETPLDVMTAVFDLETEVMNYKPISPPFGRRFAAPRQN